MARETWETGEAFNILMNVDENTHRQALRLAGQDDNGDALGRWAKDLLPEDLDQAEVDWSQLRDDVAGMA